ncbi:MAG: hypothetical protein JW873_05760 [Candidatus Saganbacteria bacterium]|nr:hypothetical protein [Candidatus Saganbacteria bacterium]
MIEQLKDQFEKLKNIDIEQLKREGKDFDFVDIYPLLKESYQNWRRLEKNESLWSILPTNTKSSIVASFNHYLLIIRDIQNYVPQNKSDPASERKNLINVFLNEYQNMANLFYDPLKISLLENSIDKIGVEDYAKFLEGRTKALLDSIEEKSRAADAIINAMKEASAETGVSRYADVFRTQAQENKRLADKWFWAVVVSVALIGWFLWWIISQLMVTLEKGVDFQLSIQIFIAKILLLSFFSVVFYQIVKNYSANMHLYTLNKHRENCLKTFQSFVQASSDSKTKDAVLIQATKSIFESGDTGFVSSKDSTISGFEITRITDQISK